MTNFVKKSKLASSLAQKAVKQKALEAIAEVIKIAPKKEVKPPSPVKEEKKDDAEEKKEGDQQQQP